VARAQSTGGVGLEIQQSTIVVKTSGIIGMQISCNEKLWERSSHQCGDKNYCVWVLPNTAKQGLAHAKASQRKRVLIEWNDILPFSIVAQILLSASFPHRKNRYGWLTVVYFMPFARSVKWDVHNFESINADEKPHRCHPCNTILCKWERSTAFAVLYRECICRSKPHQSNVIVFDARRGLMHILGEYV
jgi:hypothetical protein